MILIFLYSLSRFVSNKIKLNLILSHATNGIKMYIEISVKNTLITYDSNVAIVDVQTFTCKILS